MASASIPPTPIGWPLLPLPDVNGELHYPTLDQSVRQMIQVVLRTRRGEQLRRPNFGAGLQDYLNDPNNLTTRRRIHDAISEALDEWEPRIVIDRIDVLEVPDWPSRLRVEIVYRLRRTGLAQRLGLTMDVGMGS
jgi:phage baseplate assembly protein W